jgi:hypothetical protein
MLQGVSTQKIFVYQALSLGFYFFYWCSRSRRDINRSAGRPIIPSTWLLALPIGNYWWMWRYANALDFVSYSRIKYADTFLLYIIVINLAFIGEPFFRVNIQVQHISITLLLIALAAIWVTTIISLGFFCAVMQGKITKLPKARA